MVERPGDEPRGRNLLFTVFSLAPMLLAAIAVAGLAFGREAAQGAVVAELGGLVGDQAAIAIEGMIASASNFGSGVIGAAIGFTTFILLQDHRIQNNPSEQHAGEDGDEPPRAAKLSHPICKALSEGLSLCKNLVYIPGHLRAPRDQQDHPLLAFGQLRKPAIQQTAAPVASPVHP